MRIYHQLKVDVREVSGCLPSRARRYQQRYSCQHSHFAGPICGA